ncbi:MAG TPA: hypothetical protein PLU66_05230 [Trueperaceae bacterium]|nr:hypothetical protein [Trueperaceae bacterium]
MIRTSPMPQRLFAGLFFFLVALVCAVAPMPVLFRSLGIVLASYLAFASAGMPVAYLCALVAPPIGLIGGDSDWLVILPIVLSGNLLAMLGLEFAWRLPAILVSPALLVTPAFVAWQLSRKPLFEVTLPWQASEATWVALHFLVAALGVLLAVYLDRRRRLHAAAGRPAEAPTAASARAARLR